LAERVSIVFPCYNQEHLLEEAVESARSQAYRRLEVIVVDDGPPPATQGCGRATANSSSSPAPRSAWRARENVVWYYDRLLGGGARGRGSRGVVVGGAPAADLLAPLRLARLALRRPTAA